MIGLDDGKNDAVANVDGIARKGTMTHSILLFISGGLIIMSGTIPSILPVPADVIQGSAILSLTCTIWYLLAKTFPSHLKAMKDQREDFLAFLRDKYIDERK